MIRGLIHQEAIEILNVYAPNKRTAKYKQKLIELKGKETTTHYRLRIHHFCQQLIKTNKRKIRRIQKNSAPSMSRI